MDFPIDDATKKTILRKRFVRELNELCARHRFHIGPSEDAHGNFDGLVVVASENGESPYDSDDSGQFLTFTIEDPDE